MIIIRMNTFVQAVRVTHLKKCVCQAGGLRLQMEYNVYAMVKYVRKVLSALNRLMTVFLAPTISINAILKMMENIYVEMG